MKTMEFGKKQFKYDFWFKKTMEFWKKKFRSDFVLHKATDLGFNHMHHITIWKQHICINKHTSYNQKRIKANKRKNMLRAWRIELVTWTCK